MTGHVLLGLLIMHAPGVQGQDGPRQPPMRDPHHPTLQRTAGDSTSDDGPIKYDTYVINLNRSKDRAGLGVCVWGAGGGWWCLT